jgi:hypothetical protein
MKIQEPKDKPRKATSLALMSVVTMSAVTILFSLGYLSSANEDANCTAPDASQLIALQQELKASRARVAALEFQVIQRSRPSATSSPTEAARSSVASNAISSSKPNTPAAASLGLDRNAIVRELSGLSDSLSNEEIESNGGEILARVVTNDQRSVDSRIEAAAVVTELYDMPLSRDAAFSLLDMAQTTEDPQLHQDVLYTFVGHMSAEYVNSIAPFLRSENADVREVALKLMTEVSGDNYARTALKQVSLNDPSEYLRYLSERALTPP